MPLGIHLLALAMRVHVDGIWCKVLRVVVIWISQVCVTPLALLVVGGAVIAELLGALRQQGGGNGWHEQCMSKAAHTLLLALCRNHIKRDVLNLFAK